MGEIKAYTGKTSTCNVPHPQDVPAKRRSTYGFLPQVIHRDAFLHALCAHLPGDGCKFLPFSDVCLLEKRALVARPHLAVVASLCRPRVLKQCRFSLGCVVIRTEKRRQGFILRNVEVLVCMGASRVSDKLGNLFDQRIASPYGATNTSTTSGETR